MLRCDYLIVDFERGAIPAVSIRVNPSQLEPLAIITSVQQDLFDVVFFFVIPFVFFPILRIPFVFVPLHLVFVPVPFVLHVSRLECECKGGFKDLFNAAVLNGNHHFEIFLFVY